MDSLENPYLDSGVWNIAEDERNLPADRQVKKVLVGIDISPAEILIAKELGDIDLVIGHHPIGKGLAQLADVMHLQSDVCNYYGVPINVAEGLMRERISEVARGVNSSNHQRTVDAAKLMKTNLANYHTPCDNLAAKFLKNFIEDKNPETIGELIEILKEIPEYKTAMKIGVGPKIFVGSPDNRCGKIALSEITGGTEGSPKLYEKMAQAGVGTIIGMHVSEEHKKEAETANVNIVIAGHISSDSIGVNLFVDELEKQGIEIVPCSGFTRVSRVK
jgi:putative NIF3 family GTP cyclohydrolase 1 type 2